MSIIDDLEFDVVKFKTDFIKLKRKNQEYKKQVEESRKFSEKTWNLRFQS